MRTEEFKADYAPFDAAREIKAQQRKLYVLAVVLVAVIVFACILAVTVAKLKNPSNDPSATTGSYSTLEAAVKTNMNLDAQPCEDFYEYACGGWLKSHDIPSDQSSVSSFSLLSDSNEAVLNETLKENWPLLGAFWSSCMDTAAAETLGRSPVTALWEKVDAVTDMSGFFALFGDWWANLPVDMLFSMGVSVDSKMPSHHVLGVGQGGLSMPSYVYYRQASSNKTQDLLNHVTKMLQLMSVTNAGQIAYDVVTFESAIAAFHLPPEDLRDPVKTYNKFDLPALTQHCPAIDFKKILDSAKVPISSDLHFIVDTPTYLTQINTLINSTSLDTLKWYAKWTILHSVGSLLSDSFQQESFQFGKLFSGAPQMQPLWKRCAQRADRMMPELLGRYYVLKAFGGNSKTEIKKLVGYIKNAFRHALPTLQWLDDETRGKAIEKLELVADLVGYPDVWTDYTSLQLDSEKFFDNAVKLWAFNSKKSLERLGQPVDRTKWQMSPPTVNAYYDPTLNSINFPAGILQPPFFKAEYPTAMNFGGIGMVMGHELSHGFDDQGSQYNGTGSLVTWWPDEIFQQYKARAQCFVDQYSQFKVDSLQMNVNGNLTLGENIADSSGIRLAFRAYKEYVLDQFNGNEPRSLSFLTNDQLFFVSFAQVWCSKRRPEREKLLLVQDPHSPPFARVLGSVSNSDDFAAAFGCTPNSPMNPKDKCVLW